MYTRWSSTSVLLIPNDENARRIWSDTWTRSTCGLSTQTRCRGRQWYLFTYEKHTQLVDYDSSHQHSRKHRHKTYPTRLTSRLANLLLGPTLAVQMKRTYYELDRNGREDTPYCTGPSLRGVQVVTSILPYFPVAETLSRRDVTQFHGKYERRVSYKFKYIYLYIYILQKSIQILYIIKCKYK